jgi:hypothetical protein
MWIGYIGIIVVCKLTLSFAGDVFDYKPRWEKGYEWKIRVIQESPCPNPARADFAQCPEPDTGATEYLFKVDEIEEIEKDTLIVILVYTADSLFRIINEQSYRIVRINNRSGCIHSIIRHNNGSVRKTKIFECNEIPYHEDTNFPLWVPDFNCGSSVKGDTLKSSISFFSQYLMKINSRKMQHEYLQVKLYSESPFFITGRLLKRVCTQKWKKGYPWWNELVVTDDDAWSLTARMIEFNGKKVLLD